MVDTESHNHGEEQENPLAGVETVVKEFLAEHPGVPEQTFIEAMDDEVRLHDANNNLSRAKDFVRKGPNESADEVDLASNLRRREMAVELLNLQIGTRSVEPGYGAALDALARKDIAQKIVGGEPTMADVQEPQRLIDKAHSIKIDYLISKRKQATAGAKRPTPQS